MPMLKKAQSNKMKIDAKPKARKPRVRVPPGPVRIPDGTDPVLGDLLRHYAKFRRLDYPLQVKLRDFEREAVIECAKHFNVSHSKMLQIMVQHFLITHPEAIPHNSEAVNLIVKTTPA